jgi:hypothetical protein
MEIKHKVLAAAIVSIAVILSGYPGMEKAAYSKILTNVPADISSKELRAVVIEDFETASEWKVESTPKKNPEPKKDPVPVLDLKFIEGGPSDMKTEVWSADKKGMEKKRLMGLHFRFKYQGYNRVDLIPPPEVQWDDPTKKVTSYDSRTQTYVQENAIQLPGQAKALSMWVHGRGNDFYLEAWVKDWKGEVHILKFGSLNYVGWKPLSVQIPPYIPQEVETYPQTKLLKIVRLVVRATPDATTEDSYFFFDQLKVLTDVFEVSFDGQELDKAFKEGSAPAASSKPAAKEK